MSERWYRQNGNEGDVVISTRIRLARNLPTYPFPAGMTAEQRREVCQKVRAALQACEEKWEYLEMQNMLERDALAMVERHLISPDFAACTEGSGLLLAEDESVSLMVCEEDHLRLQAMGAGLQPDELYQKLDAIDTLLDESLHFAFDERLGYLTQCPTNLGTGMRASVMLHLPALQERGMVQQLANTVSKLGLTIRGMYGEGSRSEGALYQLSNQVTLGISEQAAIDNLKGIVAQIVKEERAARDEAAKSPVFADRVFRSLGILQNARLLSHEESMKLLSYLRMGITAGLIETVTLDTVNGLMYDVQPAAVMTAAREDMDAAARDAARAAMVRNVLS
ncbi:MAG: protein arginine kinase [Ruminococcaceae bacterium]|nr:protein arginine kinase [Oscillospiraceae bacterium]